jgi:hypothetical protein
VEPRDVLGVGERAHEDDVTALVGRGHGIGRGEHDLALGGTG